MNIKKLVTKQRKDKSFVGKLINDISISFISREDLILSKEAAGRLQDKLDIERLQEAENSDMPDEN